MPNSLLRHCKKRIQQLVKQFFTGAALRRQGVYARFNKWRKAGSWKKAWLNVLRLNKHRLDCSSVQLDGRHTRATKVGAAGGYQGREKARTTTALFLADKQGQPLACATPQAGNHPDSFRLALLGEELCVLLEAAGIAVAGLFLNADSAFDASELRQACVARDIEANITRNRRAADWQTDDDTFFAPNFIAAAPWLNTPTSWLDSFKTLLVRYETSIGNWLTFHWLAFRVLLLRKINPKPTF